MPRVSRQSFQGWASPAVASRIRQGKSGRACRLSVNKACAAWARTGGSCARGWVLKQRTSGQLASPVWRSTRARRKSWTISRAAPSMLDADSLAFRTALPHSIMSCRSNLARSMASMSIMPVPCTRRKCQLPRGRRRTESSCHEPRTCKSASTKFWAFATDSRRDSRYPAC